jgi:hypothetical protein
VANEFKRLYVMVGAILFGAAALLLLPLMKLRIPERPAGIPSTALYARGRGTNYWIDCRNFTSPIRYSCAVYSSDGGIKLMQGIFQESGTSTPDRVSYEGSSIHWKHAALNRLRLDCVDGGRPPDVSDCRNFRQ